MQCYMSLLGGRTGPETGRDYVLTEDVVYIPNRYGISGYRRVSKRRSLLLKLCPAFAGEFTGFDRSKQENQSALVCL
jgi:hypothetical protein